LGRSKSFFLLALYGVFDFAIIGDGDNEFLLEPESDLLFTSLGFLVFENSGRF